MSVADGDCGHYGLPPRRPAVGCGRAVHHRADTELLADALTPGLAQVLSPGGIRQQRRDSLREGSGVLGWNQQAGFAGDHHVTVAGRVRGHDSEPGRHGLENREREPLFPGAGHVEIEHRLDPRRILEEAGEDHLPRQAALGDEPANSLLLAAAPDEDEGQAREPHPQASKGLDEKLDPLDRIEAADAADDAVGCRQPEALPADRRFEQGSLHVLDVETVDDDDALLRPKEAEAEPLEMLGAGDIDNGVTPARELALKGQVEMPAERGVATVVKSVESVDRGHAHPPRDHPAVESRPLAVRVDDVDAESRDQTAGEVEVPRAQATERKLDDLEAAIAKPIEEESIARSADHEFELVPREMVDQIPDVLGPPAGARRHQELEDADRLCHAAEGPFPVLT